MSMLLVSSYSYGNKKAEVFQIREGFFLVEYYVNGALVNKTTHEDVTKAKMIADEYTAVGAGNQTFLRESNE